METRTIIVGARALAASFVVLATPATVHAVPLLAGFGGPAGYGSGILPANDDGSSPPIDLSGAFPGGLRFFGGPYDRAWINSNGNITFAGSIEEYTPERFPVADRPMIAPYWADVDTRDRTGLASSAENLVYWHVAPGRLVVTWYDVGYYDEHNDLRMSFQLVLTNTLTCGAGDFDVELRYARCEWTTGDASDGDGGFGGTPAQAGFDAGNGTDFVELPGSFTTDVLELCPTSNVGTPGVWRFGVRGGGVVCPDAGLPCALPDRQGACASGRTQCVGRGIECRAVVEPSSERCDGVDGDCDGHVDEGEALCPESEACVSGVCAPRCFEGGCDDGLACTASGACVEMECLDVMCTGGSRCEAGECVDACEGVVCPHARECVGGRCVDPCAAVLCEEGQICRDGICVGACPCTPCGRGEVCGADGTCRAGGCDVVSCPPGTYCEGGRCLDGCAGVTCPPRQVCEAGECVEPRREVDAGAPASDASRGDSGVDVSPPGEMDAGWRAPPPPSSSRSCACRAGARGGDRGWFLAVIGLAGCAAARRRRGTNDRHERSGRSCDRLGEEDDMTRSWWLVPLAVASLVASAGCAESPPRTDASDGGAPDAPAIDASRRCAPDEVECDGACARVVADSRNCGSCGNVCPDGVTCALGRCTCEAPALGCEGVCIDPSTDVANCGACGHTCDASQECVGGECVLDCDAPAMLCEEVSDGTTTTVCVDLSSDSDHCGTCNARCLAGAVCASGRCGCPDAWLECDGVCVDVTSDPESCGSCDASCGAGGVCESGRCTSCDGLSVCDGLCVDVASDDAHCGSCGRACEARATCAAGVCECDGDLVQCGTCVDPATDPRHCGSCGRDCGAGACVGGACECAGGDTLCDGSCVDLATHEAHCGRCDNPCASGTACSGGTCRTSTGFRITSFGATDCVTVDHEAATGSDRGGIALSTTQLFVTGDDATARLAAADLSAATPVAGSPAIHDALLSDLATEQVYALLTAAGAEVGGAGVVTQLGVIDGATGELTAARIPLSSSITVSIGAGIFSGHGEALVTASTSPSTGSRLRWWRIQLPSGTVTRLGETVQPVHQACEGWAWWGIAEREGSAHFATYVASRTAISRVEIPEDGTTSSAAPVVVATFTDLADTCSIALSLARSRWYFHHQGPSQFASGSPAEVAGFCPASFDRVP